MRFIRNVSIASLLLALTACGGGGSANGTTASGGEGLTVVSFSLTSFRALDPGFTLTVNGTGFDSTSVVLWNGVALPTKVISATKIQAAVPTADTATDLEPSFAVENNHSLSDTSEYFFLSVVAPTPKITQVLPSLVVVGSQAAEIDVK